MHLPRPMRPVPAAIVLDQVHLTLEGPAGPVNILRGVDLNVSSGTALGVVGPSGSGKTTMLMIIAGLERISSGHVEVAGTDFAPLDEDALALFRRDAVGIGISVLPPDSNDECARKRHGATGVRGFKGRV